MGYRDPLHQLPEEEVEMFFAFQLADGDLKMFDWLARRKTYSELVEMYGYKRTQLYLSLEKDRDENEPSG